MSKRVVLVSVLLLGLIGCGGLLYTATSLDNNAETVFLTDGMSVSVSVSSPEDVLSKKIRNEFRAQLSKKNVSVTDDAGNSMVVEIDKYEKGIGLFRFVDIPFLTSAFGGSFLDGTVSLTTDKGNTTLSLIKDLHMTGASEASDQTDDNVGYFVKKALYNMYVKPEKEK